MRNLVIIFILISFLSFTNNKIFTYENPKDGKKVSFTVKNEKDQKTIVSTYEEMKTICYVDNSYNMIKWINKYPKDNIDIIGIREGKKIILKGQKGKKTINEEHEIGNIPWFQSWQLGLETFVKNDKKETKFYSIQPTMLKVGLFKAKKSKTENITIKGKKYKALRVNLTIKGLLKALFNVQMYFDVETGEHLKSEYKMFGTKAEEVRIF